MRLSTSAPAILVSLAAAPVLVSTALAAFDEDFALTSAETPAGYYTLASDVPSLGKWSVGFFPSETGSSYVDTTLAPASVTFGATSSAEAGAFEEGTATLFIDLPQDGHISFTIQVGNSGTGEDLYAGAEIYLSGVALYALTDPNASYTLNFDAFSGETLEFRSVVHAGSASFASNTTTISNFTFTPAAIPEPSSAAALLSLAALGIAARRRRSA